MVGSQSNSGVPTLCHDTAVADLQIGSHLYVISTDAQQGLCGGMPPGKLVQLALSVKGGQLQALGRRKSDVAGPLACIGKHNALSWYAQPQDRVSLPFRSAVKACTKCC